MKVSKAGIALIKEFEGCRLEAYPDPATGGEPWTIGVGHTGPHIGPGIVWTQEEADGVLARDLEKFEACVEAAVQVDLTQSQFDACVALAFNIGCKAFSGSTLCTLLNAGHFEAAQKQFSRWDKAAGKVMAGLTRRRAAEAELFGTQNA